MDPDQVDPKMFNLFGRRNVLEAQPRIKGFKQAFNNNLRNSRFLYLSGASTLTNPFYRTVTFTITSTINITNVQTCIPANQFAANAGTCRRKRHPNLLDWNVSDEAYINPSEIQK